MESQLEFASDEQLAEFVHSFENGTLSPPQWTHAAHVAVASWYLTRLTPDEAIDNLRIRIRAFNEVTGSPNTEARGYHETLTVFWVRVLHDAARRLDPAQPVHERINHLIRQFAASGGLWREYYSFNVVRSRTARARWVEPDLRSLQ